jgi:plasmid stabilization system protein ParE
VSQIALRPDAAAELEEAHDWYETQRPGSGDGFLLEFRRVVARILENPMQFPVVHGDVRRALFHRFPYALFFRIAGDSITVIACFHGRRDPSEWQARADV